MSADLIAKLEAATGPDRELDRKIGIACGVLHIDGSGKLYRIAAGGERVYGGLSDNILIPNYTASLDAALTLARTQYEAMLMLLAAYSECGTVWTIVNLWPSIKAALLSALTAGQQRMRDRVAANKDPHP